MGIDSKESMARFFFFYEATLTGILLNILWTKYSRFFHVEKTKKFLGSLYKNQNRVFWRSGQSKCILYML